MLAGADPRCSTVRTVSRRPIEISGLSLSSSTYLHLISLITAYPLSFSYWLRPWGWESEPWGTDPCSTLIHHHAATGLCECAGERRVKRRQSREDLMYSSSLIPLKYAKECVSCYSKYTHTLDSIFWHEVEHKRRCQALIDGVFPGSHASQSPHIQHFWYF